MFNSIALDVVIGLIFIFLLYSLLASILQEFVAKILGLRARMLLKAIARLLDDDNFENQYKDPFKNREFTSIFYSHPNIKYLGNNEFNKKPAYISDTLFAETIIKILRTDKFTGTQNQMEIIRDHLTENSINLKRYKKTDKPDLEKIGHEKDAGKLTIGNETKTGLLEMVYDSGNDLEKFKARLEQWYNEMMDRAEGWYTKQTRLILFFIGLILAISFNINSIAITKLLSNNNTARSTMVQAAYAFKMPATDSKDTTDMQLINSAKTLMNEQIDSANKILGLGYVKTSFKNVDVFSIIGWLITALAISLGAPFWFDLLQKIMSIRQAGNKPAETPNASAVAKSQTLSPNDTKNRVG